MEKIKGGVIIIGSLFWENENNAIQEKDSIKKGKQRREWRENNLQSVKVEVSLPVKYGRCSSSRLCTYTMVMSPNFLNKGGQGLLVPFKDHFDFYEFSVFERQLIELGKVEGVFTGLKKLVKDWCAVATWINPNSQHSAKIMENWKKVCDSKTYGYQDKVDFSWSDGSLLNKDYTLNIESLNDTGFDFLMCTYIKPSHKNIQKNKSQEYPTPQEIAEAIHSSGYRTYFNQNRASGIITAEDDKIESFLN